jgi:sulfate/thiosulfate transport system permease protein
MVASLTIFKPKSPGAKTKATAKVLRKQTEQKTIVIKEFPGCSLPPAMTVYQRKSTFLLSPKNLLQHFSLPWGVTITYISIILLLPVAALILQAATLSPLEFWRLATAPVALSSYNVTFVTAFFAAAINCVAGTATAWVLVRYDFPFKRFLDAVIDLPFALPTAVAGITLATVYSERRDFTQALRLTAMAVGIAVPCNVVFGLCAAWVIARRRFPGRSLLLSIIDLPFSISPIVAGLMLVSLYGRNGLLGPLLQSWNIRIIFAFPGIALATMLGGMPFVAREVIPVLEEVGTQEEEAAKTLGATEWQTFWRVTLPSIRWALLYGIILTTARAMGEYGAIAVVSSNLIGSTQTLTLYVEGAYRNYDSQSAFAASVVLAGLAAFTLVIKEVFERRIRSKNESEN